jgi:hypothetical protein
MARTVGVVDPTAGNRGWLYVSAPGFDVSCRANVTCRHTVSPSRSLRERIALLTLHPDCDRMEVGMAPGNRKAGVCRAERQRRRAAVPPCSSEPPRRSAEILTVESEILTVES